MSVAANQPSARKGHFVARLARFCDQVTGAVTRGASPAPTALADASTAAVSAANAAADAAKTTPASFKLLRYFSLSSAFAFLVASIVLIIVTSWHHRQSLIETSKSRNITLVQLLAKTIWLNHADHLSTIRNFDGETLRAMPETREIDRAIRTVMVGLPVLKVKIYHPNSLAIYSSDPAQIGGIASLTQSEFSKVAVNSTATNRTSFREHFNGLDGPAKNVYVTETYVPMSDTFGHVSAIFEIYADVTEDMNRIKQNTLEIAILTLSLFATLYGILFLIMRRADTVLRMQRRDMTLLNTQLVEAHGRTAALNRELEEKLVLLERSNRDLQDFAHVASHDLQEPLRKIEAFGDRLVRKYGKTLPEDGQMFVDRMQDASSRMRRLITDLLSYSRTANKQAALQNVDLRYVIDGVLSDLQVRIEESQAKVVVGKLHPIDADPAQMRQLLQNLIANALKFRKKDVAPIVHITSRLTSSSSQTSQADLLVLKISDNGVGFDPKLAHKLFKVFQRLHARSEYEGSGIGLATCRSIVERHGGSIEADGRLGEGATITVTLPLKTPKSSSVKPSPAGPMSRGRSIPITKTT